VDVRDGGGVDQGQIQDHVEPCLDWAASGAARHHLPEPLHRALERDEALVQQWLKKEYPMIKALARKEKTEINFGDTAPMRRIITTAEPGAKKMGKRRSSKRPERGMA
jgi:hypothetical protein